MYVLGAQWTQPLNLILIDWFGCLVCQLFVVLRQSSRVVAFDDAKLVNHSAASFALH
jgi:hypothetical protein